MPQETSDTDAVAAGLLADLAPLGDLTSKRMFGGIGLFHEGTMFVLIDREGMPYFRADETSSAAFEDAGSAKHRPMPYWEIPAAVRDSEDQLLAWARTAVEVAHAAKKR